MADIPDSMLPQGNIQPPSALARIGRGFTDMYEPVVSAWYGLTNPAMQKQYDAQRDQNDALYLRGLLGTAIPPNLRGAVPDLWRGLGQAAPLFPLGPLGGIRSLAAKDLANLAAWTVGGQAIGQPLMSAPELWDWWNNRQQQPQPPQQTPGLLGP